MRNPQKGKISFSGIEDLEKEADSIDIDKKVSELSTSIEHIDAERNLALLRLRHQLPLEGPEPLCVIRNALVGKFSLEEEHKGHAEAHGH